MGCGLALQTHLHINECTLANGVLNRQSSKCLHCHYQKFVEQITLEMWPLKVYIFVPDIPNSSFLLSLDNVVMFTSIQLSHILLSSARS